MRRVVSLLLSAGLLLGLMSGCQRTGEDPDLRRECTARGLADAAFSASGHEEGAEVEYLSAEEGGEDLVAAYLENAYQLEDAWEDAAVIRATGASAFEIAVLQMEDSDSAVRAASALMSYTFSRQGDFAGYAPAEADMVANGSIMQDGPFAALFICPDPEGAYKAVEAALNGEALSGSGPSAPVGAVTDLKELRDCLVSYCGMDGADLEKLDGSDPDALNAYVRDVYGLSADQWEECAIARGTGNSAFEVAVMRVLEDCDLIEEKLNGYLDSREAAFDSSSEQGRLLHGAIAGGSSPYILLLACEDSEGAIDAFCEAAGTRGFRYSPRYQWYPDTDPDYSDRCKFTPPNKDDMSIYDTSAILAAWEKGDPAGLSKYDRDIYDQAKKVLDQVLRDGMSGYEKELAVYNWVVQNVNYDWTHQNVMEKTPRESFTPYGGLVNHTAVCLGYAATFQLLMDLAGVECITVTGAAFSSQEDHGWNMVKLNGEWYCLDVTWDANLREHIGLKGLKNWEYFNVTSDYMADTDHQWDYANTPEATAGDRGQG